MNSVLACSCLIVLAACSRLPDDEDEVIQIGPDAKQRVHFDMEEEAEEETQANKSSIMPILNHTPAWALLQQVLSSSSSAPVVSIWDVQPVSQETPTAKKPDGNWSISDCEEMRWRKEWFSRYAHPWVLQNLILKEVPSDEREESVSLMRALVTVGSKTDQSTLAKKFVQFAKSDIRQAIDDDILKEVCVRPELKTLVANKQMDKVWDYIGPKWEHEKIKAWEKENHMENHCSFFISLVTATQINIYRRLKNFEEQARTAEDSEGNCFLEVGDKYPCELLIAQEKEKLAELESCMDCVIKMPPFSCFARQSSWVFSGKGREGPWERRPLADIRTGDYVLALNEVDGRVFADRVAINFHLQDPELHAMIEIWHTLGKLVVTPEHVVFAGGAYVAARHVHVGQWMLVAVLTAQKEMWHGSLESKDFATINVTVEHLAKSFDRILNPLTHSGRILVSGSGNDGPTIGALASTAIESPNNVQMTMCSMPSIHKLNSWLFPVEFQSSWLVEGLAMRVTPWNKGMAGVLLYDLVVGLTFLLWHSGLLGLMIMLALARLIGRMKPSK